MIPGTFHATRKTVVTQSGQIAFIEHGAGPAVLFVHGFPLNGYHWRYAMEALGTTRRCIAPDLMGLGYTDAPEAHDLGFEAQAVMLLELIEALSLDQVDLVGNDSGGAIAQLLAIPAPHRIRSLTLTNCDTIGNWPPPALEPVLALAKAGRLGDAFMAFQATPDLARAPGALGAAFEFPERLTSDLLNVYLGPLTASEKRRAQAERYVIAIEQGPPKWLQAGLKALEAPTLIVWGEGDPFFPVHCGAALRKTIPGARTFEILPGAKLFFPEERSARFCALLMDHLGGPRQSNAKTDN